MSREVWVMERRHGYETTVVVGSRRTYLGVFVTLEEAQSAGEEELQL